MNTFRINGAILGNGTQSPNRYFSMSALAQATGTLVVRTAFFISGSVTAGASSVADMTRTTYLQASQLARAVGSEIGARYVPVTAAVTAVATSVADFAQTAAKALSGAITARATSVMTVGLLRNMLSSVTAVANWAGVFKVSPRLSGTVTCGATTSLSTSNSGQPAPDERQILVPEENRYMEVVE